ncbi:FAD-dependent oxidoreductase [Microbacterium sp. LRZ72]|uniref:FAD-dependent oxidoreductase n=1 Tax=Microbacterium sp. LRZ72 TaxID=2942481 RepID=UPI0039AFC58A
MNGDGRFDLIVVGAGMAGVAAANKSAAAGWKTAIVDDLPFGGTCALRGCDPKKILRRAAEVVESARLMSGKGIAPGSLSVDWGALMRHKHGFTDPAPHDVEQSLKRNGVTTTHGTTQFAAPDAVAIDGKAVTARHVLIATGARPRTLAFPGSHHVIDSTAFMELEQLPGRLLFVGGGFISFEFAHLAARSGSSPLIVDHGTQPLKAFDPDLVNLLLERGAADGIRVRTATSISSIEPSSRGYRVQLDHAGQREFIEVARCGSGIRPRPAQSHCGGCRVHRAGRDGHATPAEHEQSRGLRRGRRRRYRGHAADSHRGRRREGRRIEHDQVGDGHARLHGYSHRRVHPARTRPSGHAGE